jgi:uncharacterized membrane protein YdjX (TVP38/TMEM64 family)
MRPELAVAPAVAGAAPSAAPAPAASGEPGWKAYIPGWLSVVAVLGVCLVMMAVFAFYAFFAREVTHWMEGEHHWFHDYEPWSLIGFIGAFIVATALFLPAQPFVVAVGYLFGFHFLTIFFTFAMYTLSAFLMFNGARFWFRPMVEIWLREHRLVEGMAQYVKNPREGAKVNLLFSFTPLAFCLHCYAMGITEIKEEVFMVTFLLGQSPHIFFGVFTGSALLAAETSDITMDWAKMAMLGAGIGGTFLAVVYLGHVAHEILGQLDDGCSNERLLGGEKSRHHVVRCGVGLTFEEADDRCIVVSAIAAASPAANGGVIRVGDVLHEVDGRSVHRADLGLVARLVPGDQGTNVELGLKRRGSDSGPMYRVLLQRSASIKTYGAIASAPQSPAEGGSTWEDRAPSLFVAGNASYIADQMGAHEVTVSVSSAIGASVRE